MKFKMKMFNMTLTFMALSALVTLVTACGGNTNSISSNTDAPGIGALGVNVDIKDCQVNQAYTTQYGCLNRNQCQYGSGYSAQANQCVAGQLVTRQLKFGSDPGTRHYGRLTVTNAQQMEVMLQASGLCSSTSGQYSGQYSGNSSIPCSQFISRGTFALVESYSGVADNINIVIGAGTTLPTDLIGNIPGLYGTAGIGYNGNSSNYVSFNQQAHNYSFNAGNGMQLVGMLKNNPISFMVLVNNGNLGLDHLDASIIYQNTQVATVTLNRLTNF
jgi:hypothetical protein